MSLQTEARAAIETHALLDQDGLAVIALDPPCDLVSRGRVPGLALNIGAISQHENYSHQCGADDPADQEDEQGSHVASVAAEAG